MPALLCVPILVQDEPTALADAQAARDAGADMVEFRVDEIFSGALDSRGGLDQREVNSILRLVAGSPLPAIVTCRTAAEGGHYDGDDAARVALYERLGTAGQGRGSGGAGGSNEAPPRYLDIEHAAYSRSANIRQKVDLAVNEPHRARDGNTGLILSMHDCQGRPSDLWRRAESMQLESAARIVKVAITARSVRDNLDLFDLLAENAANRPMIALAMGRFGLMSRVLASKFRSFLTFASLRPGSETAPGQPTVRDLVDVYRFRSITPSTRVYGLIAWPVEHSFSPLVHNAGFETLAPDPWELDDRDSSERTATARPSTPQAHAGSAPAIDGVYLPIPVPPEWEHFKATLGAMIDHPRLDFSGCSVSIPHKQHLVRFARESTAAGDEIAWEIDPLAQACGAANTLVVRRDRLGSATGARVVNTDAAAGASCLAEALGGSLAGKRVAIVGAGGVARAIAAGVLDKGGMVMVFNRTRPNADALVADLRGARKEWAPAISALGMDAIGREPVDAVVNCTPLGMRGGPGPAESPLSVEQLRRLGRGCVVMDTVYNPVRTPLLAAAKEAGLKTIDGLEMFVRQAGEQFSLWTGRPPPLSLFRRVCSEAMADVGAPG